MLSLNGKDYFNLSVGSKKWIYIVYCIKQWFQLIQLLFWTKKDNSNWKFLAIAQYCAIRYFLLLRNTVQLKIFAIAQYCAIENFLLLHNTVQLLISCYCWILCNWKFLAIAILNIIILDPDLDQLENWNHNQKSKYMFRFSESKKPKNSIFVKIKLSLILDPLDFNVDQFENGTKN